MIGQILKASVIAVSLMSATALTAQAEHRQNEAVVFKHPDFRGDALVIKGPEPNLAEIGFNDTISSIEIYGRWEICVDPDFRGKCTVIDGSVHRLSDLRMNDNITSLRPLRRHPRYGADDRNQSEDIVLFKHPDMRGDAIPANRAIPDLKAFGFNDTVSSVIVNYGAWLLCEHPDFRGRCEVVDGPVWNLNQIGLNDRVSSIKPYSQNRGRNRRYGSNQYSRHLDRH